MKLTEDNKRRIDAMGYAEMLERSRFAPIGDPWFRGETGTYWVQRESELRKELGWGDAENS
jgi:hypothetical protein